MTQIGRKPALLFVGASGTVASKVLPALSERFDIVGISRTRTELAHYCVEHLTGDLLTSHETLLGRAFALFPFDAIIWNAVAYFPSPITRSSREILHTEFDLSAALVLACVQYYLRQEKPSKKTFVAIASQMAFGTKPPLASYSIAKGAQIALIKALAQECPDIHFSAVAPASVKNIRAETLSAALSEALRTKPSGAIVRVDEDVDNLTSQ